LNCHYGRTKRDQAIKLLKDGARIKGLKLLNEAGKLVEGWTGIYSKLIMGLLLGGNEQAAVDTILKAIIEEHPEWKENLSCFYFLRNLSGIKRMIITLKGKLFGTGMESGHSISYRIDKPGDSIEACR
jgi:hypothetical protein